MLNYDKAFPKVMSILLLHKKKIINEKSEVETLSDKKYCFEFNLPVFETPALIKCLSYLLTFVELCKKHFFHNFKKCRRISREPLVPK